MDEIANILLYCLQYGRIFDPSIILRILTLYVNERKLYGINGCFYIKNLPSKAFGSFKCIEDRYSITIDLNKIINSYYNKYRTNYPIGGANFNVVHLIDYAILLTVFHEVRHAEQEFCFMKNSADPIIRIFQYTNKIIDRVPNLYREKHDLFPIEKDAECFAYEEMIELLQRMPSYLITDQEMNYLFQNLINFLIAGYDQYSFLSNPLKNIVLSQNREHEIFNHLLYLVMEKLINFKELGLYQRLALNFPISAEEENYMKNLINFMNVCQLDHNLAIKQLVLGRR